METEIKLLLAPGLREALERHPALLPPRATPPELAELVTTYFDTPDFALSRAGVALRVRRLGDARVQTVKSKGQGGVASRRGEWEWPVTGDAPDLSLLAGTGAEGLIDPALARRLGPAYATDVRRTTRLVCLEGSVVELALDEGEVLAGRQRRPLLELELELKAGDPAGLVQLALELTDAAPLRLGIESKAAQGYRLATATPAPVAKAGDVTLEPETTVAEGFRRILLSGLEHLLANIPAAQEEQVEGVHQLRVALRRLRATLVLFRPLLEPGMDHRFEAELQRLGRVAGGARDWDVFRTETIDGMQDEGWRKTLDAVAAERQAEAHATLRDELARPALTRLALALTAWAESGAAMPPEAGAHPLCELAPELLEKLGARVEKRGRKIRRRSIEELHELRKALKKLRYGLDDLSALLPEEAVRPYLKRCRALQERLGEMNDAAVAAEMAGRLALPGRRDLVAAIDGVTRRALARQGKALDRLYDAWEEFQEVPPPWRSA